MNFPRVVHLRRLSRRLASMFDSCLTRSGAIFYVERTGPCENREGGPQRASFQICPWKEGWRPLIPWIRALQRTSIYSKREIASLRKQLPRFAFPTRGQIATSCESCPRQRDGRGHFPCATRAIIDVRALTKYRRVSRFSRKILMKIANLPCRGRKLISLFAACALAFASRHATAKPQAANQIGNLFS